MRNTENDALWTIDEGPDEITSVRDGVTHIDILVTRSSLHKGTAIAGITSKLNRQIAYSWKHFRVGFPIFTNIFIPRKKTIIKCCLF